MDIYALFGNPIAHSKSPYVHNLFSKQIQIPYQYECILTSKKNFINTVKTFFRTGGKGANITAPFKEDAFKLADKFTERASITGAVNTLKYLNNGKLLGDNTDCCGLLNDLRRLSFIKSNFHILLIGAGGAARSILFSLLSFGCTVTVTNRTFSRAEKLISSFKNVGNININKIQNLKYDIFDLIINATSSGVCGEIPTISSTLITPCVRCYDLSYQNNRTPFLHWCKQNGAQYISNGIGMLIEQAAHSVLLWHGILPDVKPVIDALKQEF